jgi:SAM-dependent methyltransferase
MMTEKLPSPFLFSFYESLPRQGPGDEQITRLIITELLDLPKKPKIIDMGCGTGSQTRILAEMGEVIAVDIHQPFLDILMQEAEKKCCSKHITPLCSSMDSLPVGVNSGDLIWSEGAIYIIGFERGLIYWYDLIRPGGYIVVSELTRLTDNPPKEAADFWNIAYPAVKSVADNCQIIESAGYHCLKTLLLPSSAWDEFYAPQIEKIQIMKNNTLTDEEMAFLDEIEQEISIMQQYPDCYGYVFYVMQKPNR